MKRLLMAGITSMVAVLAFTVTVEAQTTEYVRYQEDGGAVSWGVLEGETIYQLSDAPYLGGERTGESVARESVMLEAPVNPKQIFMTAFNFRSHLGSREPAEEPQIFLVAPSSIIGPEEPIIRPPTSENLHYEAEMVVVVGDTAVDVSLEDAPDYIFGVTAGNDVSERAWQGGDIQWTRAKGSRNFNAVGPVLVTGLDYHDLDIEGRLNGEVVQGENSSDLLFDMHEMLSYISHYFTIYPGDLIWTGTMGSTQAMEPGDVYEVEIEGVGTLSNVVEEGQEMENRWW